MRVATQWLLDNVPSSISLEEDQYLGRWRILCSSGMCKSVAWSRRGLPHACDLVLYHSWKLHASHTGEEPPFDIEHGACMGFERMTNIEALSLRVRA